MMRSHIVSLPMSEVSASRAREIPEGVKTIPRGCSTGCLTLPFRTLYKARYVIAVLLVSSISGHRPEFEAESTSIQYRSTTVAGVSSGVSGGDLPVREIDPGTVGFFTQKFLQGDAMDGPLGGFADTLPPNVVVKKYWSTAEKEGLPDDLVDGEAEVMVVDLGMWTFKGVHTIFILPDQRVLCR